jgi:RHS repeat-associated protein
MGSVTEVTTNGGNKVESYRYDVYGVPTIYNGGGSVMSASVIGNRLLFTGRDRDTDTGWYNYRYRYYNPTLGRFMQPDPIGLAGGDLNLYRYVRNNPVNWVDLMGLDWRKELKDIFVKASSIGISVGASYTVNSPSTLGKVSGTQQQFMTGSVGVSVNTYGQLSVQWSKGNLKGSGYFWGAGLQAGLTWYRCPNPSGRNRSTQLEGQANVGALASIGLTGDLTPSSISGGKGLKIGVGVGAMIAKGEIPVTTVSTPALGN